MRAVVQRVKRAAVTVGGDLVGAIGPGCLVLLGISTDDKPEDADYVADKVANLRLFEDEAGKMNLSLLQTGGAVLAVSQFTLYGDVRRGRRPGFDRAARPESAMPLYERFVGALRTHGLTVQTGRFQAHMEVELVNDGPVTILIDTEKSF